LLFVDHGRDFLVDPSRFSDRESGVDRVAHLVQSIPLALVSTIHVSVKSLTSFFSFFLVDGLGHPLKVATNPIECVRWHIRQNHEAVVLSYFFPPPSPQTILSLQLASPFSKIMMFMVLASNKMGE
jgi:hypothetical protein